MAVADGEWRATRPEITNRKLCRGMRTACACVETEGASIVMVHGGTCVRVGSEGRGRPEGESSGWRSCAGDVRTRMRTADDAAADGGGVTTMKQEREKRHCGGEYK